ncbi:MAG: response regulator [Elusimicrobiota bacterium]
MINKKILIVDDDLNIVELLEVNLKACGYETISASDGHKALDKINTENPDLIILDVMMPGMDGWEVCKIIRDHHGVSNIKILFLTGKDKNKDKLIGIDVFKADKYITKPFDLDFLIDEVAKLLSGQNYKR